MKFGGKNCGGGKGGMRGWGLGHDFRKIYASIKLSDKLKFYKKKIFFKLKW